MLLALFATAMTLAVTPLVLVVLRRAHVVDHPTARSSHDQPTPRGGGIALALSALITGGLSTALSGDARVGVLVAAASFGALGLLDDLVGVPPLTRLAAQVMVAAAAAPWLILPLPKEGPWGPVLLLVSVFALVGYVNAFNFMDGINGISVAQAVVAGVAWYAIGRNEEVLSFATGGAILAGATVGFAPFNVWRARLFLGDVGSYFLGAWIASVAIVGLRAGIPPEAVGAPLALYLVDSGTTLVWRVARGECWYEPHRDHAYQRLVRLGWSHLRTTLFVTVVITICAALGAVSLTGNPALRVAADLALLVVLTGYVAAPSWVARPRGAAVVRPLTS
jgi:UDP-N-acetylmuramyl pentapeptide phosphotransferase/UDP-N-acetylglucosamine-1-phosphate transferase